MILAFASTVFCIISLVLIAMVTTNTNSTSTDIKTDIGRNASKTPRVVEASLVLSVVAALIATYAMAFETTTNFSFLVFVVVTIASVISACISIYAITHKE